MYSRNYCNLRPVIPMFSFPGFGSEGGRGGGAGFLFTKETNNKKLPFHQVKKRFHFKDNIVASASF